MSSSTDTKKAIERWARLCGISSPVVSLDKIANQWTVGIVQDNPHASGVIEHNIGVYLDTEHAKRQLAIDWQAFKDQQDQQDQQATERLLTRMIEKLGRLDDEQLETLTERIAQVQTVRTAIAEGATAGKLVQKRVNNNDYVYYRYKDNAGKWQQKYLGKGSKADIASMLQIEAEQVLR